jgi:hypothetical protein
LKQVTPNSLADSGSMRSGDVIVRIGDRSVDNLTHSDARSAIIELGNYLELTLQRFDLDPSLRRLWQLSYPWSIATGTAGQISILETAISCRRSICHSRPSCPHRFAIVFILARQGHQPSISHLISKVAVPLKDNKMLLTQSYNSPLGLYSKQNVADALVTTVKKYKIINLAACCAHVALTPTWQHAFASAFLTLWALSFYPTRPDLDTTSLETSISTKVQITSKPIELNSTPKPFNAKGPTNKTCASVSLNDLNKTPEMAKNPKADAKPEGLVDAADMDAKRIIINKNKMHFEHEMRLIKLELEQKLKKTNQNRGKCAVREPRPTCIEPWNIIGCGLEDQFTKFEDALRERAPTTTSKKKESKESNERKAQSSK